MKSKTALAPLYPIRIENRTPLNQSVFDSRLDWMVDIDSNFGHGLRATLLNCRMVWGLRQSANHKDRCSVQMNAQLKPLDAVSPLDYPHSLPYITASRLGV